MAKKKKEKARISQTTISRIKHKMEGITSISSGHQHLFSNITDQVILRPGTHMHTFRGFTTTTNGVRHFYSGVTGPAINGTGAHGGGPNHFHRFRVVTTSAGGHVHIISGTTTTNRLIKNSTPSSP